MIVYIKKNKHTPEAWEYLMRHKEQAGDILQVWEVRGQLLGVGFCFPSCLRQSLLVSAGETCLPE